MSVEFQLQKSTAIRPSAKKSRILSIDKEKKQTKTKLKNLTEE